MKSRRTASFRKAFDALPEPVREQARLAYRRFEENPNHPGLRFKRVHSRAERYAKFWLKPISLARSRGFRSGEISEIQRIVEEHRALFEERWHEHLKR